MGKSLLRSASGDPSWEVDRGGLKEWEVGGAVLEKWSAKASLRRLLWSKLLKQVRKQGSEPWPSGDSTGSRCGQWCSESRSPGVGEGSCGGKMAAIDFCILVPLLPSNLNFQCHS